VSGAAPDPRVERAEEALAAHGIAGATVRAEGPEGEIAAIRCPAAEMDALLGAPGRRAAEAVREAGFRYVALDLDVPDAQPPPWKS
jgi:PP-loop superfamily ATP-utilizing enzyme